MPEKRIFKKNQTPSGKFRVKACYKGADGKYKYKSFMGKTLKEAESKKQRWILEHKGEYSSDTSNITLRQAYHRYIDNVSNIISPSTLRDYTRAARADFPMLMDKKICDIKQTDIQSAVNLLARNHAPKTVRNAHGLLSAVMHTFRPEFQLTTKLPTPKNSEMYVPSSDDIEKLMDSAKGTELGKAILLAAFGSFRRSEIAAFVADDLDRKNRVIHVNKAMVRNKDNQWVIKNTPKTKAGFRDVELPDFVIDQMPTSGKLVNLLPSSITHGFVLKLKKLDLPHFRFHDLRHYHASILHAMGIPDQYIMARGGWESDYTLKNVYRHTMDEKRKETEKEINAFFSNRFDNSDRNSDR